jgi:histidine triad (HIT) family protein
MAEGTADCVFCKIVAGGIPADVVHEGDLVMAFRDLAPVAPTHVLVVPRRHHRDVGALVVDEPEALAELVRVGADLARVAGHHDYRLVFNTGAQAHQTVFHAHLHVLGGRSMGWPPG